MRTVETERYCLEDAPDEVKRGKEIDIEAVNITKQSLKLVFEKSMKKMNSQVIEET